MTIPMVKAVTPRSTIGMWELPETSSARDRAVVAAQLSAMKELLAQWGVTSEAELRDYLVIYLQQYRWSRYDVQRLAAAVARTNPDLILRDLWPELERASTESPLTRLLTDHTRTAASLATSYGLRSPVLAALAAEAGGAFRAPGAVFGAPMTGAVRQLMDAAAARVTTIDATTRAGLLEQLTAALQTGTNPLEVARRLVALPGFGPTPNQAAAIASYRRLSESGRFAAAADRGLHDRRFRSAPTTPEDIDRMVARYAERMSLYRARNIARTEMLSAAVRANRAAWAATGAHILKFWATATDEASTAALDSRAPTRGGPCPVCAPIPGLNRAGHELTDPFDTPLGPLDGPLAHPSCRCTEFYRPAPWVPAPAEPRARFPFARAAI